MNAKGPALGMYRSGGFANQVNARRDDEARAKRAGLPHVADAVD